MSNGHVTGGSAVGAMSTDWQVAGIGDIDGDGTSDVLWRNTGRGQVGSWTMANGHVEGGLGIGHVSTRGSRSPHRGDRREPPSANAELLGIWCAHSVDP